MCMIEDAEIWRVYRTQDRRARRDHRCEECDRRIATGERYHHAVGLLDGDWYTMRCCAHCRAAAEWLVVVCGGYIHSAVLEELREHWNDEPDLRSRGLARLIIGMRHRWNEGAMKVPTWAGELGASALEALV